MRKTAKPLVEEKQESTAGPAAGIVIFVVAALITAYLFATNGDFKPIETYWFINDGLCLWVPLMVILFVLREEPGRFGMQRGDARLGLKWALICWLCMLPFAALASTWADFRLYYIGHLSSNLWGFGSIVPYGRFAHTVNPHALLYYELAMGFYMFCWEFFFRGFLLFGLERTRLGSVGAVIVQTIPFVLLHWLPTPGASKPLDEIIGSAIAGPILGILALRTRSFLYGFLAHWAVSLTFDLLVLRPFILHHVG
ncbi:MAG: CPBP family intramembrane glutamic endopeptidase [Capsulimonadaceae bacterium]